MLKPRTQGLILALLIILISCKPEKESSSSQSLSDLSGSYTLTYVGPDSRAIDSNMQIYCGGKYQVNFKSAGKEAKEYSIYSKDTLFLFHTRFKKYVIVDNFQGTDSIAGYELTDIHEYTQDGYTKADSLMIGDLSVFYRSALFHKDHFLIYIAGKDYNNKKTYLRFDR